MFQVVQSIPAKSKRTTVPIVYSGGSYGTFVEWCLMYFSGQVDYLPFRSNGNSHEYKGNLLFDIHGWRKYLDSDDVYPVARLHPKILEHESVTENLNEILSAVDRAVFLYTNEDLFLLIINNKFEKIFQEGYMSHIEKSVLHKFSNWGVDSLKDMDVWQLREFLSYYMWPQHLSESGIDELRSFDHPGLLKVNVKDLIADFRGTIETLLEYCNLPKVCDNFEEIYCKWIALQRHSTKDHIVNTVVDYVVNDKEIDWSELELTIVDEAIIQWALRSLHSLEIKCYNLNVFPTNTNDLRKLLVNVESI
jgi:hypothetical protein